MADATSTSLERAIAKKRLKLLKIAHYFIGIIEAIFQPLLAFLSGLLNSDTAIGPINVRLHHTNYLVIPISTVVGIILFSQIIGGLTVFAGHAIKLRKYRSFIWLVACLNLICLPLGTILGVITLRLLSSKACKEEFKP